MFQLLIYCVPCIEPYMVSLSFWNYPSHRSSDCVFYLASVGYCDCESSCDCCPGGVHITGGQPYSRTSRVCHLGNIPIAVITSQSLYWKTNTLYPWQPLAHWHWNLTPTDAWYVYVHAATDHRGGMLGMYILFVHAATDPDLSWPLNSSHPLEILQTYTPSVWVLTF